MSKKLFVRPEGARLGGFLWILMMVAALLAVLASAALFNTWPFLQAR